MTGTNCDLFTQKQSRSYLNQLVHVNKEPRYVVGKGWMGPRTSMVALGKRKMCLSSLLRVSV